MVLTLAVIVVLAASLMIPTHWKVSRSIVMGVPPGVIYPLVADWKNWPKWSAFASMDPETIYRHSGAPSGVGAVCDWKSKKMGEAHNVIVKGGPESGIVYEMEMPGWPKAEGNLKFTPEGSGTRVDFIYEGNRDRNPIHRMMSLVFLPMLGKNFEDSLAQLKTVAESKTIPTAQK